MAITRAQRAEFRQAVAPTLLLGVQELTRLKDLGERELESADLLPAMLIEDSELLAEALDVVTEAPRGAEVLAALAIAAPTPVSVGARVRLEELGDAPLGLGRLTVEQAWEMVAGDDPVYGLFLLCAREGAKGVQLFSFTIETLASGGTVKDGWATGLGEGAAMAKRLTGKLPEEDVVVRPLTPDEAQARTVAAAEQGARSGLVPTEEPRHAHGLVARVATRGCGRDRAGARARRDLDRATRGRSDRGRDRRAGGRDGSVGDGAWRNAGGRRFASVRRRSDGGLHRELPRARSRRLGRGRARRVPARLGASQGLAERRRVDAIPERGSGRPPLPRRDRAARRRGGDRARGKSSRTSRRLRRRHGGSGLARAGESRVRRHGRGRRRARRRGGDAGVDRELQRALDRGAQRDPGAAPASGASVDSAPRTTEGEGPEGAEAGAEEEPPAVAVRRSPPGDVWFPFGRLQREAHGVTLRSSRRRMVRVLGRTARMAGASACVVLAVVAGACGGETHDGAVTADRAPSRSEGCDRTGAPSSGTVSLRYDGLDRSYDLVVPRTRSGVPMPLVLGYHGLGGSPHELSLQLADRAQRDGFVAVFPRGSSLDGSTPAYFNLETVDEPLLADDVGFTRALLDRVEADLCIDRARIYAMGMSNGGMFVSTLACELGDRIAAVAPVAGVHVLPDCPGRPVPIIVTHGTVDPLVPFDESDVGRLDATGLFDTTAGGSAQLRMFEKVVETPVTSWVESWARHNGCSLDAPEVTVTGNVERSVYAECDGGGDVVLEAVTGGGHEWPTSPTLDVTARALAFFRDHPLPGDALDR